MATLLTTDYNQGLGHFSGQISPVDDEHTIVIKCKSEREVQQQVRGLCTGSFAELLQINRVRKLFPIFNKDHYNEPPTYLPLGDDYKVNILRKTGLTKQDLAVFSLDTFN